MTIREFAYYGIVLIGAVGYFWALRWWKLRLLSFCTINYVLALILALLPGYSIAAGEAVGGNGHGFDETLYTLYLLFAILTPIGIVVGRQWGTRMHLSGEVRPHASARMALLMIFVVAYTLAYVVWLPYVPFHDLLLQRIDVSEAAFERVDITHQWASVAANPPFVFRYWRPIIQELSLLGFAYFTAVHYSAARPRLQKRNSVGLLLLFGFTAYCMVFTLEKATLIYLVWCYFLIRHMIDPRRVLKRMVFLSVTVLALCCVMLVVFMGVETLPDTLSAIWFRMQGQTASVYVQNEYIMSHGFLGLHGIHMPVLSSLLGADYYVNLPGYAYEVLLPELSANGRVGSAAGFSIAELYFAFGWWGAALFGVVVTAYGFLDQVILNSCQEASLGIRERAINVGFYAATSSWYSLLLVGSVLGILSFPFVCSETFFFFLAGYLLVMKVHGIKMRSVAARWRLLGRDARSPLAGGADA